MQISFLIFAAVSFAKARTDARVPGSPGEGRRRFRRGGAFPLFSIFNFFNARINANAPPYSITCICLSAGSSMRFMISYAWGSRNSDG